MAGRLFSLPFHRQEIGKIEMGFGMVGLDFQSLFVPADGLLDPSLPGVGTGEVQIELHFVRFDAERPSVEL